MRILPSANVAGIANGVFYLIGGTFAGTIVMVFTALPKEFIAVLAGLALIGAIAANITAVVREEDHREASIIRFPHKGFGWINLLENDYEID
jgi:benzoate membrane transport protein